MAQFSLSDAQPFNCKKKANPSRNKLARQYTITLVVEGATNIIEDVVTWQDKGAGRDWYEATSVLGIKMYKHNPEKYNSNETEWKLWNQNDVVRANTPSLYGQFVVEAEEHNCSGKVPVNVLVQDRGACFCIPKIDLLIDLRNPPTHPPRSIDRYTLDSTCWSAEGSWKQSARKARENKAKIEHSLFPNRSLLLRVLVEVKKGLPGGPDPRMVR